MTSTELKKPEMLQYEYARQGLELGLKLEKELGVNPFKFGMIGSTDSHTSATAEENNFFGKHSGVEPNPQPALHPFVQSTDKSVTLFGWEMTASGYAGVWATDNTREAIFDALMRKEVYATTGPRMVVRFFGGWHLQTRPMQRHVAPLKSVIPRVCRWVATCPLHPTAKRLPSS